MLAVRVQCPHCGNSLKLRQAPTPGRRLLCVVCDRTFAPAAPPPLPDANAAPAPDWALAAALPKPPEPPPVVPPPPIEPSAPDVAPGPRRGLLLGGIVGGLVLLVGSTALAVALASRADRRRQMDPVAKANASSARLDLSRHDEPLEQRTAQPGHQDTFVPPQRRAEEEDRTPRPRSGDRPAPLVNNPPPPVEVKVDHRAALPRELQTQVNAAIDKGVELLKAKQMPGGSWETHHPVGMAALPGLTLLECGVKADDECIQKAAKVVREKVMKLNGQATYESSLALLFLDRLGDKQDKELIRSIALRLVAGQLPGGGWSYNLPALPAKDERELMEFLNRTRPNREEERKLEATTKSGSLDAFYEAIEAKKNDKTAPKKQAVLAFTKDEAKTRALKLPAHVRGNPSVIDTFAKPGEFKGLGSFGDNSNTQFAMLALWAARRHDLPLERALDAVGKRFRDSQLNDGTWRYLASKDGWGTPAMTGSGLLGLAVGHGSATDPDRKFKVKDAKIDKGLAALGKQVGKPLGADAEAKKNKKGKVIARPRSPVNLYFLWTVERVGVLYDVRELDGKDWYLWGVELLLPAQEAEGGWQQGNYPGSTRGVDTRFALLFLKRANLASDLTRRLDFVVEGKPGK